MDPSLIDPNLIQSFPPDAGLLATMALVEEFQELLQAYDAQSQEPEQVARGERIRTVGRHLKARPALNGPPPPPPQVLYTPSSSLPSYIPETQLPSSSLPSYIPETQLSSLSPRDASECRASAEARPTPTFSPTNDQGYVGDAEDSSPAPIKPNKKRPALKAVDAGLDDGSTHPKRRKGCVTQLAKHELDETDVRMKKYLQAEMLKMMHVLVGYGQGRTMPCEGGPSPDEDAGPGPFLTPDFKAKVNDRANLRIQQRAAHAIRRNEDVRLLYSALQSENGLVPPAYCTRWLDENVLIDLAQRSWPGMKSIWSQQKADALDMGTSRVKKQRRGRRNERRKLAAAQIRRGLREFCEDQILDYPVVIAELVSEEWMGEEWSCDEDELKNESWRTKLFATGRISAEERDDPDLQVLEEKRPIWMHINLWNWFKQRRAGRSVTQKKPEKKRVDLGRLSHHMPQVIPFDFMLDPQWMATELPKWDESYWIRRSVWPVSFGTRGERIAKSILAQTAL
ncbi:hypothetical protein CALVIDRAFT_528893 [Calocera viscosa TUFC12733]|uniref:Uncharacterized protein n=1 Tax=Calocera viscosa (strain TUFC12733) TaxID=1330018 RepID=A0A167K9I7_CALVF|nr:hypothetical protein CALVIDRAFT_528893 [Calocera viscosa TUFC12733]